MASCVQTLTSAKSVASEPAVTTSTTSVCFSDGAAISGRSRGTDTPGASGGPPGGSERLTAASATSSAQFVIGRLSVSPLSASVSRSLAIRSVSSPVDASATRSLPSAASSTLINSVSCSFASSSRFSFAAEGNETNQRFPPHTVDRCSCGRVSRLSLRSTQQTGGTIVLRRQR